MDRPSWVTNEYHWRENCREIVQRARDVVEGRVGIIEAARVLKELAFRVRAEEDPDFVTFRVIDSESHPLPVGPERKNWSADALEREDAKIAAFEEHWLAKAVSSARSLAQRYASQ
jgi:hypothetical protein